MLKNNTDIYIYRSNSANAGLYRFAASLLFLEADHSSQCIPALHSTCPILFFVDSWSKSVGENQLMRLLSGIGGDLALT